MSNYTFKVEYDQYSDNSSFVMTQHFKSHRDEVLEWMQETFPEIDLMRYEGGIDSWFGLGSVMLCELGIEVHFKYTALRLEVTMS